MDRAGIIMVWLGLAASGCGGPLKSDELRRGIESLENYAATAEVLAQGVIDQRSKTTFVRASARELGDSANHEAEKLADSEGQEPSRREAVTLAEDLGDLIRRLQVHPDDPPVALRIQDELQDIEDRAADLAKSP